MPKRSRPAPQEGKNHRRNCDGVSNHGEESLATGLKALPANYWRDAKGLAHFQIVFAGMESGLPVSGGLDIRATRPALALVTQRTGLCRPDGATEVLSFGLHDAIDVYLPTYFHSVVQDPAAGVRTLVQLEIEDAKSNPLPI
jgi:hypothetical protein